MNAAIASLAKQIQSLCKGDFREEDHPRADDGKFGSGGGSGGGGTRESSVDDYTEQIKKDPATGVNYYTADLAGALADGDTTPAAEREAFSASILAAADAFDESYVDHVGSLDRDWKARYGSAIGADEVDSYTEELAGELAEAGGDFHDALGKVVRAFDRCTDQHAEKGKVGQKAAGRLEQAGIAVSTAQRRFDAERDRLVSATHQAIERAAYEVWDSDAEKRAGELNGEMYDGDPEGQESDLATHNEELEAAGNPNRLRLNEDGEVEFYESGVAVKFASAARLKGTWREEDHDRADDGKFGSGGGSKKPAKKPSALSEAREGGKTAVRVAGKLASKLSSLASSAKESAGRWARKLSAGLKGNLSPRMRKRLKTAGKWVAGLEHFLNAAKSGAQAVAADVAEQEARLRGLTPGDAKKHGDRVGKVVKAADAIASWVENVPLAHDVLHHVAHAGSVTSFLAAKAAFYVPVGSLAYLAMASAANPIAVMDSASKLIAGKLSGGKHKAEDGSDAAKALSTGLLDAADQEVYLARVFAGLDLTGGDLSRAVKLASAEEKKSLASVLHKLSLALKGNFREEDHPRADDGKFGANEGRE